MTMPENDKAQPEYVKAKTAVWWDINSCPLPHGYDARRVRPSIESALKNLGYSGPVDITVIGYLEDTPQVVLRGLSSTGIYVKHGRANGILFNLLISWQERNPPPASMMLISDKVEDISLALCHRQQRISGYNLLRVYNCIPEYVSILYNTGEWLWESLLATDEINNEPETRIQSSFRRTFILPEQHLFYCSTCCFPTQSLEIFTTHLSGEEHEIEVSSLLVSSNTFFHCPTI
ncbi:hypothetical protein EUTSA_v10024069mg [Eutrema salsugineum]|uniref:NYN domain-containing protein n=1 Tax=Eutrema salsugineum TaxID=72664 RepID=V4MCL6_EUTSA|nr:hypothetical protein EUTSA_v10024069mg [Eutrema salsugineum]